MTKPSISNGLQSLPGASIFRLTSTGNTTEPECLAVSSLRGKRRASGQVNSRKARAAARVYLEKCHIIIRIVVNSLSPNRHPSSGLVNRPQFNKLQSHSDRHL
jgi:hypothetical protein